MKSFSLSAILDAGFYSIIIFATGFFGFLKPFGKTVALLLAIFVSLVAFTFFIYRNLSKTKMNLLNKKEKLKAKRFSEFLCVLNKKDGLNILKTAFTNKYLEVETEGNYFTLKDKKLKLFFFFSFDGLKKSEVVFAFNRILGDWSATIYCNNVSPEVLDFSKRFSNKINIQSGEDLYAEIKDFLPLSVLPRTTINERKSLKPFLSKKSARKTFLFGALFLIISSFVTFKTYYVVFGTIFLIFSFINYFFSKTA